jgi:hypothetical protein
MPKSMPPLFFPASQSVDERIGTMFSFIWANYAGLRELWWQTRGFVDQYPGTSDAKLKAKFFGGLPLPGGVDLKKTCIMTDWEAHERDYSKWILLEACTFYEAWLEKVCGDLFPAKEARKMARDLQFPIGRNRGKETGYRVAIQKANTSVSPLLTSEFFPVLKTYKLNRWSSINEHLTAYRYFKECRNSLIHSSGAVTDSVVDWHGRLSAIQASPGNPFRHQFALASSPVVGEPLTLVLRDTVLLTTIVRSLICTLDAALCVTSGAETHLADRFDALINQNRTQKTSKWLNLPSDKDKALHRVRRMLVAARIPEPVSVENLVAWLKAKRLIP